MNLKLRNIAPPGGFIALAPTGKIIRGNTFTDTVAKLTRHMTANGHKPDLAEEMVDEQTAEKLYLEGHHSWIQE